MFRKRAASQVARSRTQEICFLPREVNIINFEIIVKEAHYTPERDINENQDDVRPPSVKIL